MTVLPAYTGPQCPRCNETLTADWIRDGAITCPYCSGAFEATVFTPPEPKQLVTAQVTEIGPDGANACANHARNAATASCQRCGLFICSLCDMNVGSGSFCPSCFERVRADGTLQTAAKRYRDSATVARSAAIVGLLFSIMFLGLPFGAVAVYYGIKARRQRRMEGRSVIGVTIITIVGVLEMLAGIAGMAFMIYAIAKAASS
jgi:hypothetical protein